MGCFVESEQEEGLVSVLVVIQEGQRHRRHIRERLWVDLNRSERRT
ncbi:MAG: hypothetical protein JRF33_26945 [Deltaproteobacteria bacterium]|nr:hypothetical protein [Deltaproteobacteria bacterium]